MPIFWLVLFIVCVVIELGTMALTTIWFAGGAVIALLLSVLRFPTAVQVAGFLIVSFALLFLTRPLARRYLNSRTVRTNAQSLLGKEALITQTVDNRLGTGTAVVGGQEWTARASEEKEIYEPGATVRICDIQGVKLIVEKLNSKEIGGK